MISPLGPPAPLPDPGPSCGCTLDLSQMLMLTGARSFVLNLKKKKKKSQTPKVSLRQSSWTLRDDWQVLHGSFSTGEEAQLVLTPRSGGQTLGILHFNKAKKKEEVEEGGGGRGGRHLFASLTLCGNPPPPPPPPTPKGAFNPSRRDPRCGRRSGDVLFLSRLTPDAARSHPWAP